MSGGVGGGGRRGKSGGGGQCSGTARSRSDHETLWGTTFSYCQYLILQFYHTPILPYSHTFSIVILQMSYLILSFRGTVENCILTIFIPSLRASPSCEVKTAASLDTTSSFSLASLPGETPVINEAAAIIPDTSPEMWVRWWTEEERRERWSFTQDGRPSLTTGWERKKSV